MDRMPHIWCPGCGIGTTVNCFARALEASKVDLNKVAVVSGIGCTGRVAGYANLDSFHTTHGRAIPFATGLKLSNPELSGGGVLGRWRSVRHRRQPLHSCRPAQHGYQSDLRQQPDLRHDGRADRSGDPDGSGLGHLAIRRIRAGVSTWCNWPKPPAPSYVARWTTFHVKQLSRSMEEMMQKKGFCFIEMLSPCPTLYQRRNKMGDGLDAMKFYKQVSKIRNGAPTANAR